MDILVLGDSGTLILKFTSVRYGLSILAEWSYGTYLCDHIPRNIWPGPSGNKSQETAQIHRESSIISQRTTPGSSISSFETSDQPPLQNDYILPGRYWLGRVQFCSLWHGLSSFIYLLRCFSASVSVQPVEAWYSIYGSHFRLPVFVGDRQHY